MKARDGTVLADGARVVLILQHGDTEREVEGTISSFTDDEGVQRWELLTPDVLQHPSIGFLPENVVSAKARR